MKDWLANQFEQKLVFQIRKNFFQHFCVSKLKIASFAEKLAQLKVLNLSSPQTQHTPMAAELEFEAKLIKNPSLKLSGIFYDGFRLQTVLRALIPRKERRLDLVHIVFTNRLFGTFDEADRHYHARVIICGYPSIISTTGIVEAPAKPRDYYVLKQQYTLLGAMDRAVEQAKKFVCGRFIDYDDVRMTEVMKGYVLQAVFYHLTGNPFCKNKNCRLYDAHWQEEVIRAQLLSGRLCCRHKRIIQNFDMKNSIKHLHSSAF